MTYDEISSSRRLVSARAAMAEHQAEEMAASLIDVKLADKLMAEFFAHLRKLMGRLPAKVASRVVQLKTAGEIQEVMYREFEAALNEAAEFKFSAVMA
ncbi:MAG: hypothetical protein ACXWJ6_06100 [Xanthobacteraceae bacterium]